MSGKRNRQYLEDPAVEWIPEQTRSCYLSQTLLQKERERQISVIVSLYTKSNDDIPLYSQAHTTVFEYNFKILEYSLTHSLTKRAVDGLLKLISDILPHPNNAVRSLYKQDKFFTSFLEYPIAEVLKYCSQYHHLLDTSLPSPVCSNGGHATIEKFLMCDIEQQLIFCQVVVNWSASVIIILILFSVPISWQAIQSRFTRSNDDLIHDIYDGILYMKHSQPGGFLSHEYPANLSFTLSTDGVKVFKSSVSEVWPVWLVVNKLPPNMRSAANNHTVLNN